MEDSDEIRGLVERKLEELKLEAAEVSRRIGRGRTYLFDYIVKRSPKVMPDEQKLLLAPIIAVQPAQLGVFSSPKTMRRIRTGMAEDDVADYVPGPDTPVAPPHIVMKRILNRALDQHPRRLVPNKVVAFNTRLADPKAIEAGAVVWAQLAQRSDPLTHRGSVIRQFLPPDKLVTNSSEANEIMSLDDEARDLVAVIMGTMIPYVIDDMSENELREETVAVTKSDLNRLAR